MSERQEGEFSGKCLEQTPQCGCGRVHRCDLTSVQIGPGVLEELPAQVRALGFGRVFLLMDKNTRRAAGERAAVLLRDDGLSCTEYILPGEEPVPDEAALGGILAAYPKDCDLLVAVGSGTINDLGKFVSFQLGRPCLLVATAASMDGFASPVAALFTDRLKTTYPAHAPVAILADTGVLCAAPPEMLCAGFGDLLGKYTCLCDWKLAALVTGEYYCDTVEGLMREALERAMNEQDGVRSGSPAAVEEVTDALVASGIAMSYAGNSRPASGSEHHISHLWEMRYLQEGRKPVLHGIKVGIGTLVSLRLYEFLRTARVDFVAARERARLYTPDAWEAEARRVFGPAAEGVIRLERQAGKNAPEAVLRRLAATEQSWREIQTAASSLPSSALVEELLRSAGAPVNPMEIGVDRALTEDGIRFAKEVRDRYTVLQLLWDLGLLDDAAHTVTDSFFKPEADKGFSRLK